MARADRAAALLLAGAGVDDCFPGVVFGAAPPDFPAAPGGDLGGLQGAVERGVPLGRHGRVERRQVVEARQDFSARAVGAAAAASRAVGHGGAVAVASVTKPPDPAVGAFGHLVRRQVPVFLRVPLGRQARKARRKVVLPRLDPPPRAVRAARSPDPGADHGLIAVAPLAAPPDPLVAAVGDGLRGQGCVARRVPLGKQFLSMLFRAEIEQGFFDGRPPPFFRSLSPPRPQRIFSPVPTKHPLQRNDLATRGQQHLAAAAEQNQHSVPTVPVKPEASWLVLSRL